MRKERNKNHPMKLPCFGGWLTERSKLDEKDQKKEAFKNQKGVKIMVSPETYEG